MRRHPLLAVLIAATALLAGCGDDNQDPVLEPTPLSSPPTTASPDTGADDTGTSTDAGDDGDSRGDTDSGDDGSDDTSTTTTEADGDTVTTTSERLDPDDPDYPTVQPSPPVTYPEADG